MASARYTAVKGPRYAICAGGEAGVGCRRRVVLRGVWRRVVSGGNLATGRKWKESGAQKTLSNGYAPQQGVLFSFYSVF
eukprot:309470-Chlamydomonas_euryale.AAC.2